MAQKLNRKDFLVSTIRNVRQVWKNMKPGTAAGVQVHEVFQEALSVFTENEMRQALNELLHEGVLLMTATTDHCVRGKVIHGLTYIQVIPLGAPLQEYYWNLNNKGDVVKPSEFEHYAKRFSHMRLYVTADGLPERVKKKDRVFLAQIAAVLRATSTRYSAQ